MYKKGFTLLEVILSLIFISMIATYSIIEYKKALLNKAIVQLHDTVYFMISDGIIIDESGLIGYTNGTGNPGVAGDNGCSPNSGQFDGLTSQRLYDCMGWNDGRFIISGNILRGDGLMDDYGSKNNTDPSGCSFETRQLPSDVNSFEVFIDCSNIVVTERTLSRIEDMIANLFGPQDKSNLIATHIYRNAVDLTTNLANETSGSGNPVDGMLRARFSNQ